MKVYITYETSGYNDTIVSKVFADKELAIQHAMEELKYLKGSGWTDERIREHAENISVDEFEVEQ